MAFHTRQRKAAFSLDSNFSRLLNYIYCWKDSLSETWCAKTQNKTQQSWCERVLLQSGDSCHQTCARWWRAPCEPACWCPWRMSLWQTGPAVETKSIRTSSSQCSDNITFNSAPKVLCGANICSSKCTVWNIINKLKRCTVLSQKEMDHKSVILVQNTCMALTGLQHLAASDPLNSFGSNKSDPAPSHAYSSISVYFTSLS